MTTLEIAKFWMCVFVDKTTKMRRNARKHLGHCWIWKGSAFQSGYGRYFHHQMCYRAHRVAFFLEYGEIPENLFVCHRCDNPLCVNPLHLFLGTPKDNTYDMIDKGRLNPSRGENKGATLRENGKWRAQYMKNYKSFYLGTYDTKEEALEVVKKARLTSNH